MAPSFYSMHLREYIKMVMMFVQVIQTLAQMVVVSSFSRHKDQFGISTKFDSR